MLRVPQRSLADTHVFRLIIYLPRAYKFTPNDWKEGLHDMIYNGMELIRVLALAPSPRHVVLFFASSSAKPVLVLGPLYRASNAKLHCR
jgi:hypothetical protein